jgi:hypothetical protein
MFLKARDQRDKIYDACKITPKKLKTNSCKPTSAEEFIKVGMRGSSQHSETRIPPLSQQRYTRIEECNKDLRNISKELHNKTHFKGAYSFLNNSS